MIKISSLHTIRCKHKLRFMYLNAYKKRVDRNSQHLLTFNKEKGTLALSKTQHTD